MSKKLKTHLKNADNIRNILRNIEVDFELDSGDSVDTLLTYLPCKKEACEYSELFQEIKNSILSNFVLSYNEIKEKLSIESKFTAEDLFKKAVRKLSKHTAKGELGELLLFTMLEVYFDAPKILSKISLKTSRRMPVYGADAVHAQYLEGNIRLYLGEAKLHRDFKPAAISAIKSISNARSKYEDEFDLIESHIDFPEMDTETRNDLLDLLNPFSASKLMLDKYLHSPCFIGFVNPDILSDDDESYKDKFIQIAAEYIEYFFSNLTKEGNNIDKTILMLLPFSSIDEFVAEFISYMGIKK